MKPLPWMKNIVLGVDRPTRLIAWLVVGIALTAVYPSDLGSYPPADQVQPAALVVAVDHYGRFVDTALQVALPLILGDSVGVGQLACVAVAATLATHGLKWFLNDKVVLGTRLGERPSNSHSKHNMPSGHSSMASCAVYFVCRRYGLRLAWVMVPVMLLTMYARFALEAHTVSAVLCGALIGILAAVLFTSRYVPQPAWRALDEA
jgi:lipid A 1-phosphatase